MGKTGGAAEQGGSTRARSAVGFSPAPSGKRKDAALPVLDEFKTRDELAELLGLSTFTLARWDSLGQGPVGIKVGRRVLYRIEAVNAWLREQEKQAEAGRARRTGEADAKAKAEARAEFERKQRRRR